MENKDVIVLKKVLIIRVIQIIVYSAFICLGFWMQISYYHGKNVILSFVIIGLIYDLWTKILTPVFNCPRYVILDFKSKTITIKYISGKKIKKNISEIKKTMIEYEEVKSLTKEPNTNVLLYLPSGEKIKICLLGLLVNEKNKILKWETRTFYELMRFFGESLTKGNENIFLKQVEGALKSVIRTSEGLKTKLAFMCYAEKILNELGMKIEDYAREIELYDYLPWEKFYKLKQSDRDCIEEILLRIKRKKESKKK